MALTLMVGCLWLAAYLDWTERRDAYVARVRERLAEVNLVDAEFIEP
jgi:hypothetical protein